MREASKSREVVQGIQLTRRYGSRLALNGVSLMVEQGEAMAILGPNGAGKTTLINLMLGLLQPTAGSVTIFGRDPKIAVASGWAGAMLQEVILPSLATVRDLVRYTRSLYPHPLPLTECLELADIADFQCQRVDRLSGDQRRRVQFALALVGQPRLLFLDEPTEGMDVEARGRLWDPLRLARRRQER